MSRATRPEMPSASKAFASTGPIRKQIRMKVQVTGIGPMPDLRIVGASTHQDDAGFHMPRSPRNMTHLKMPAAAIAPDHRLRRALHLRQRHHRYRSVFHQRLGRVPTFLERAHRQHSCLSRSVRPQLSGPRLAVSSSQSSGSRTKRPGFHTAPLLTPSKDRPQHMLRKGRGYLHDALGSQSARSGADRHQLR